MTPSLTPVLTPGLVDAALKALSVREYLDRENVAAIEAGDTARELATARALELVRKNFPIE